MTDSPEKKTRRIEMPEVETLNPIRATTGPLEDALPWVIEFRVVGTAATIQAQVHEAMLIGRSDLQSGIYPAVDLGPHGAQTRGVSRQHAMVLVKDNRIKIKDLGSVNGTRLNGYALQPQQEYRLRHGDELEIGQMKLQVRFAVEPTLGSTSETDKPKYAEIPILGQGQHVLVVEDDADVGKVFKLALQHAGFEVSVVENAVTALNFVDAKMPDVIVLDLMLPDMTGDELITLVRKQPGGDKISMIVCSGVSAGFTMNKAMEAGANHCLAKPVSVEDLVKAVSSFARPVETDTMPISQ